MQAQESKIARAGYNLKDWCESAGFCRATYYNLPPDLQPKSVRILGRRIIIEPPDAYLQRVASREIDDAEAA
jgi:hypothetical protein